MSSNNKQSEDGTIFMGVRVSKDMHQRLYKAKARLELTTGKFYGMGRLLTRILKIGLNRVEELDGVAEASSDPS